MPADADWAGCRGDGAVVVASLTRRGLRRHELDVSVLLLPLLGFLPATDPKMKATIAAVRRELSDQWLVYRWQGDTNPFVIASFWLIECMALLGDVDEAREGFEVLLSYAGPTGLFSEEVTPADRQLVGNLPQAFSHVGLINAAWRLSESSGGTAGDDSAG